MRNEKRYKRQNKKFINEMNYQNKKNGDGVKYLAYRLNYKKLDEAIYELGV